MTPDRWKRIEALYHEARARPPADRAAFLAEACADDEAMRRDVESLLDESESDDGFLAAPPLALPAHWSADLVPATMTGRRPSAGISCRRCSARAAWARCTGRTTRSSGATSRSRSCPRAFTSHPDRLARFEREARMLAALNHPNICAIYGFEEADGIRFLVLELVEGDTLAETLAQTAGSATRRPADCRSIARWASRGRSPTRSRSPTTRGSSTAT